MSQFSEYFDKEYSYLEPQVISLDSLLKNDTKFVLIAGDFFGIQKFIFEGLGAKNAAKVLRAKSAFVEIFTRYLAQYICHSLDIDERYIITAKAGKFEILSPNVDSAIIEKAQRKIDAYFIDTFYALSGVSVVGIACSAEDFREKKSYKQLRDRLTKAVEAKKFKKFDLQHLQDYRLNYDTNINNQTLCRVCNIRKVEDENCLVCNTFITLGKLLVKREQSTLSSAKLSIVVDDFICDIVIDKKIKSYVLKEGYDMPASFESLANNSCQELKTGIKALGILKADVDSMGKYLKDSSVTDSFENFDMFSKSMDNFFSLHVTNMMREKYINTYTVFAGGDDLFLVGAWDEILALSRDIHHEFKRFIKAKLSISFGIALAKPSHPISYLAEYTENLLEEAKAIDEDKNAITLFNETMKFTSYLNTYDALSKAVSVLDKDDTKSAFLYRLLEIIEMSKRVKLEGDIESTIWKSKLNYSFYRTMDKRYEPLLKTLNEQISRYPQESKAFFSEYIYKRREV